MDRDAEFDDRSMLWVGPEAEGEIRFFVKAYTTRNPSKAAYAETIVTVLQSCED